jgi:hypothetical protein
MFTCVSFLSFYICRHIYRGVHKSMDHPIFTLSFHFTSVHKHLPVGGSILIILGVPWVMTALYNSLFLMGALLICRPAMELVWNTLMVCTAVMWERIGVGETNVCLQTYASAQRFFRKRHLFIKNQKDQFILWSANIRKPWKDLWCFHLNRTTF